MHLHIFTEFWRWKHLFIYFRSSKNNPANKYMLKINKRNYGERWEICLKLFKVTYFIPFCRVSIVTLNRKMFAGEGMYWTDKTRNFQSLLKQGLLLFNVELNFFLIFKHPKFSRRHSSTTIEATCPVYPSQKNIHPFFKRRSCGKQFSSCLKDKDCEAGLKCCFDGCINICDLPNIRTIKGRLTHSMPVVSFYTPWKYQKTAGFFIFSEGIEKDQWN